MVEKPAEKPEAEFKPVLYAKLNELLLALEFTPEEAVYVSSRIYDKLRNMIFEAFRERIGLRGTQQYETHDR